MASKLFIPRSLESTGDRVLDQFSASGAGFVKSGLNVTIDPANTSTNDQLQLVWKRSDGSFEHSPAFRLSELVNYTTAVYSAGTAQVVYVTPTLPATETYGTAYTLRVINTNNAKLTRKTFTVTTPSGGFQNVNALCEAFVAAIGTNTEVKVVATEDNTKIILTSTDVDSLFRVACDDLLLGATITYQTAGVPSNGTAAKVTIMEANDMAIGKGVTNRLIHTTIPATQVLDATYDISTFNFALRSDDKSSANVTKTEDFKLVIAEPAGSDVVATQLFNAINGFDLEALQDRLDAHSI